MLKKSEITYGTQTLTLTVIERLNQFNKKLEVDDKKEKQIINNILDEFEHEPEFRSILIEFTPYKPNEPCDYYDFPAYIHDKGEFDIQYDTYGNIPKDWNREISLTLYRPTWGQIARFYNLFDAPAFNEFVDESIDRWMMENGYEF